MQYKPLVFGISGTKLTIAEKEFFANNPVFGFIIFGRNIESSVQLKALINELKSLYLEHHALIFIDQEGGRVARLKPPIVKNIYKSAAHFGELYIRNRSLALSHVYENYRSLMHDLKSFDIDSPCAPVADLLFPFADSVIGDRSFGLAVKQVVDLCIASINAIEDAGGISIMKHIPGHGRATCDSHQELPYVNTAIDELNNTDFAVFKALTVMSRAKWAMTAHVVFDAIDSSAPVTLSKKAIQFIREQIGFEGTLISDDICMLALHGDVGKNYREAMHSLVVAKSDNNQFNVERAVEEYNKAHQNFVQSLSIVASSALKAGCEYVLHCSGNIDEMRAIYKAV